MGPFYLSNNSPVLPKVWLVRIPSVCMCNL